MSFISKNAADSSGEVITPPLVSKDTVRPCLRAVDSFGLLAIRKTLTLLL